jgi:hypothetical protein
MTETRTKDSKVKRPNKRNVIESYVEVLKCVEMTKETFNK